MKIKFLPYAFLILSNLALAQWIQQNSGTTVGFKGVHFIDSNTGSVVGQNGTILRTTDGGTTWIQQPSGTTNFLDGVYFTDSNKGIVVGENGTILRTTDGGTTWIQQTSGTTFYLQDVFFTDVNKGTVVGYGGIILSTTDGGTTWAQQSIGSTSILYSICFTNASIGTAVGNWGIIIRTTDGGTTWTLQASGTTNHLRGVSFTDANTGTIVGDNGIILRTTDGGINWIQQTSGTTTYLCDVSFLNSNVGTAVGNNGVILRTTNGGQNWAIELSGTSSDLLRVCFTDPESGTAVGYSGTILRRCGTLYQGLVAYYPFNGDAIDESGNGHNGTLHNVTLTQDRFGEYGKAYSFLGDSSSYIITSPSPSLDLSGAATLVAWVKGSNSLNCILRIIGITNDGIEIGTVETGTAQFNFSYSGNWFNISSNSVINNNNWHLVVAVVTGNQGKLFVDGQIVGNSISPGPFNMTSPAYIIIGRHPILTERAFNGVIDDLCIYNRELSESEIMQIYNLNGWSSLNQGLVAYYPFNGNAYDESGNNLNLITYGDPVLTTDRFGNSNSAFLFNGTTDYFYHDSTSLLKPQTELTINAWIYNEGIDGWQDVIVSTLDYPDVGGYQIILTNPNKIWFEIKGGHVGQFAEVDYSPNYANKWTMITGVYSNQYGMILYADGIQVDQIPGPYQIVYEGANGFRIGTNPHSPGPDRMFKGKIDDVSLFNRVLSYEEIQNLYHENGWPTNSLILTTPNGGENWQINSDHYINWSSNLVNNIDLYYSTNNGFNWNPIDTNIPANNYSYLWTVPNSPSNNCLVKITDAQHPEIYDSSDSTFSINLPNTVENNMILFNDNDYIFSWSPTTRANSYNLVFYFADSTSNKTPVGFTGDSLVIWNLNTNHYTLNLNVSNSDTFVVAKYYWRVFDNDWNPITNRKSFINARLIRPINLTNQPVLLVHGWNSDISTWIGNQNWNGLLGELADIGYSPWLLEYPNNDDIRHSAWVLSVAIDSIIQRSLGFLKVNILAHSMGGLVTRAYSVGMGRDLLNNNISYNHNIKNAAFLATPNQGGRFVWLAELLSYLGIFGGHNQYAVYQLEPQSTFMIQLNSFALNNEIKYLAIGGYDNNYLHLLISWGLSKDQINEIDIGKIIATVIADEGISDCIVTLESAIKAHGNFFDQYKIIYRNHANIIKNELLFNISAIVDYLEIFYPNGIINSDDFFTYKLKSLWGGIIDAALPGENIQNKFLTGAEISLQYSDLEEPYIAYTDPQGLYSFNFLPQGNYKLKVSANGYFSDSTQVNLNDTTLTAIRDLDLMRDSSYQGPTNPSVIINSGNISTNNLTVMLTLNIENGTEMMIDEKPEFPNSIWQPFSSDYNYTFQDTSQGSKVIFVKFRNSDLSESNIVKDQIYYNLNQSAQINVTSSISDANIYLNGSNTGFATPNVLYNIPFSDYLVTISKNGYGSDPTHIYLSIDSNKTYQANFNIIDIPPQTPANFICEELNNIMYINLCTASDFDLNSTRIVYKMDGNFPNNPNDGTILIDTLTSADSSYNFIWTNFLSDTIYYFAAFSMDNGNNYSGGFNLAFRTALIIPVELSRFEAISEEDKIELIWTTATETNNKEFVVERSVDSLIFSKIGTITGHMTTTLRNNYSFTDKNLLSGIYYYRLKQMDLDGRTSISNVLRVSVGVPTKFSLSNNFPNPFNNTTRIKYSISKKSKVRIEVFNTLGQKIEELVNEELDPGYYHTDFNANKFASGVYIFRIIAGKYINSKKMILLK